MAVINGRISNKLARMSFILYDNNRLKVNISIKKNTPNIIPLSLILSFMKNNEIKNTELIINSTGK